MRHKSVKLETPCEFINITPINPLISKCQIKVCYVGDEPNRNRSIITKDVAREIANSLPGSPIVGFYNESTKDFETHNKMIDVKNGEFKIIDTTRPYGFVPTDAKCWFAKYEDDDSVQHEYLVTEGYLWTGQYPEAQRIMEHGDNQSMELDDNFLKAEWTKDENGKPKFFVINEAIISKLCILGEDYEPCFEGSNITPIQFSFDDGFKDELMSMMKELKEYLLKDKGGAQMLTKYAVEIGDSLWGALYSHMETAYPDESNSCLSLYRIEGVYEDENEKFAVLQNRTDLKYFKLTFSVTEENTFAFAEELQDITETYVAEEEPQFALDAVEQFELEYKKKDEKEEDKDEEDKSDNSENEDKTEDKEESSEDETEKEDKEEDDEEDKKKKKYSLDEIPEYTELLSQYSELKSSYDALVLEKNQLQEQLEPLVNFRKDVEKKEKQAMIDKFYMLSDEDKADVISNIDTYSLDEVESKLCVICVRNGVGFDTKDDDNDPEDTVTYSLSGFELNNDSVPAWVKAAAEVAKTLNN